MRRQGDTLVIFAPASRVGHASAFARVGATSGNAPALAEDRSVTHACRQLRGVI
ncbi:hypothetical protein JKG68_02360 [Microvirga aerilata]|uniref:Uncharacterized protein n=1 Tax=Microvirga aerilata TaxID=670292 RepID=A0A936ZE52_9HYPH|nr:hypothetical protein [Microvirga aerilata]MBL0402803.1 hypothetical protein [Microvirga aerilata]